MKALLLIFFFCSGLVLNAQTTINNSKNTPKSPVNKQKETKHKILLVPFSNKLYMSEIDHVINSETKQTQNQIRWDFKDGIDEALFKELKGKYDVVSLIEDTAKNKKEIAMVEAGVGYKFDKSSGPEELQGAKKRLQTGCTGKERTDCRRDQ